MGSMEWYRWLATVARSPVYSDLIARLGRVFGAAGLWNSNPTGGGTDMGPVWAGAID
jgi:hypothetical protein